MEFLTTGDGLRLHLQPAVRFITLACNAPALVEAHAQGRRLPALRRVPGAHWLLWRVDGDAHWRRLDADEAALLQAVFAGETFGDLCERATDFHAHDGPLRAASVLKRWLADGLLAIDPPAPAHRLSGIITPPTGAHPGIRSQEAFVRARTPPSTIMLIYKIHY